MKVAIIIDGGYLDKVTYSVGNPKFNYSDLANRLSQGNDLIKVGYYHCLPYKHIGKPETIARYNNKFNFYNALSFIDKFEVKLGKLIYRGTNSRGEEIYEQKRVDSMIATDIVSMSIRKEIDSLILIAGDGDHIPAIEVAMAEGVMVTLYHGSFYGKCSPSLDLYNLVPFKSSLDELIKSL